VAIPLGLPLTIGAAESASAVLAGLSATAHPISGDYLSLKNDATLEINGQKTDLTGDVRRFYTPPLNANVHYSYTLKVTSGGKSVTREVDLSHGVENVFDLLEILGFVRDAEKILRREVNAQTHSELLNQLKREI